MATTKKVAAKKASPATKKSKAIAKKAIPVAKKSKATAQKAAPVAKKKVAIKTAPKTAVKKKPIVVKKLAPAKKKAIAIKKVAPKAKPIAVKKAVIEVKKKPVAVKEAEVTERKRPAIFNRQIGSAKKRSRARSRKAAKELKATQKVNKATQAGVPQKRLIIEKPTMKIQPESTTKKVLTGSKKIKYTVEMDIHASPRILYPFLSTSSGLAEWFAPHVDDRNDVYTFEWEGGSSQSAKLVTKIENHLVRFHWIDDPEDTYFEIEIVQDEMTSDVALIVTDFCLPGEKQENIQLWESQIHDLMHIVGSQF